MKGFKNNANVKKLRPDTPSKPEDVKAELFRLRDKIALLVESNPAKAATLLTQWLESHAPSAQKTPVIPRKKAG